MNKDIKYLVFGMCVAFVLLCAFVGVALASTRWHVEEGGSVHVAVDNATDGDKAIVYSWTHEKTTATGPLITIEKNTQESIGIDNDTICVSLKLSNTPSCVFG